MSDLDFVILSDLAEQLGVDRSNLRKFIKNCMPDTVTLTVRDARSGNQLVSALSTEDAQRCVDLRTQLGFGSSRTVQAGQNYLYAVRVDPELRPGRVKLGTSTNPDGRFGDYRTIAPQLEVVRLWPAPPVCEGYLLSVAAAMGERVGAELFDFSDEGLSELLTAVDAALSCFK